MTVFLNDKEADSECDSERNSRKYMSNRVQHSWNRVASPTVTVWGKVILIFYTIFSIFKKILLQEWNCMAIMIHSFEDLWDFIDAESGSVLLC